MPRIACRIPGQWKPLLLDSAGNWAHFFLQSVNGQVRLATLFLLLLIYGTLNHWQPNIEELKMSKTFLTHTVFICLASMPLYADLVTLPNNANYQYSGDTSLSGNTFDRPIGNGNQAPNMLSPTANSVGYDTLSFQVTTSGIYNLDIAATNFAFDSYLFLYQTSFDPAAPLTNVLLGETNGDTTSSLTATLLANTVYTAVATGFANFDEGPYTGTITETAPLAPEPSTFVLILAIMLFPAIARTLRVTGRHLPASGSSRPEPFNRKNV